MSCPACGADDKQHQRQSWPATETDPAEDACMECLLCGEFYDIDYDLEVDDAYEAYKNSQL